MPSNTTSSVLGTKTPNAKKFGEHLEKASGHGNNLIPKPTPQSAFGAGS